MTRRNDRGLVIYTPPLWTMPPMTRLERFLDAWHARFDPFWVR